MVFLTKIDMDSRTINTSDTFQPSSTVIGIFISTPHNISINTFKSF